MRKLLVLLLGVLLAGCSTKGFEIPAGAEIEVRHLGGYQTNTVFREVLTEEQIEELQPFLKGLKLLDEPSKEVYSSLSSDHELLIIEGSEVKHFYFYQEEGKYYAALPRKGGLYECSSDLYEKLWDYALIEGVPRMIRVEGNLYLDTGIDHSDVARCGVMDGTIDTTTRFWLIPEEDNQSNFGTGYSWQRGSYGTIEVNIDGQWIVFQDENVKERLGVVSSISLIEDHYNIYISGNIIGMGLDEDIPTLIAPLDTELNIQVGDAVRVIYRVRKAESGYTYGELLDYSPSDELYCLEHQITDLIPFSVKKVELKQVGYDGTITVELEDKQAIEALLNELKTVTVYEDFVYRYGAGGFLRTITFYGEGQQSVTMQSLFEVTVSSDGQEQVYGYGFSEEVLPTLESVMDPYFE